MARDKTLLIQRILRFHRKNTHLQERKKNGIIYPSEVKKLAIVRVINGVSLQIVKSIGIFLVCPGTLLTLALSNIPEPPMPIRHKSP